MDSPAPPRRISNYVNKVLIKLTNNSYVYFGYQINPHAELILKYIPLHGKDEQIDREYDIQILAKHKYIMPLQNVFTLDDRYRVLAMDVAKGSLVSGYAEGFFKSSLQIYKIMYQITKGLAYLHSEGILHGDIKPSNIVMMNTDEYMPFPRIIDFGHAQFLKPDEDGNYYCKCNRLTVDYSAPEVLRLEPHSYPSDIFSLGVTFYFLITEELVLKGIKSREARAKKLSESIDLPYNKRYGNQFPETGKKLIFSMLNKNPDQRPTASEVLNSVFFKENVLNNEKWAKDEEIFSGLKPIEVTNQDQLEIQDTLGSEVT